MNEILKNVKDTLEREANLLIEDSNEIINLSKKDNHVRKNVVDNRFECIKQIINSTERSNTFYTELIQEISIYIEKLYDRNIDFCNVEIVCDNEIIDYLDTIYFNSSDDFLLTKANRELSEQLFNYVCSILENNKDIVLNIETLKRLFNRNPKLFTLSVEESYIDRPFRFDKLAKIINENQTLQKSNIDIDKIYELLIDTCQVDKEEIFINFVKPEEYKENHKKIDELLTWCNARTFVSVTKILITHFDNSFDRFKIIKERNKNKFCEILIMELLKYYVDEETYDLIHQILTDPEIEIDYNLYQADYIGETELKSSIALSGNKIIIKDLLSKEKNIQNYYSHGEHGVRLYTLYASIGEYEKAIANFEEIYNFKSDIDDENKNWDRSGFAYGSWGYKDSLAEFINSMCDSFKDNNVDYITISNIINRILNNEKVKYINITETLSPIQKILSPDDFKLLVDNLTEKYNSGNLGFLTINEHETMFTRYIIRIASKEEVEEKLNNLKLEDDKLIKIKEML